ncbi:MAG: RNA polymerase sigma factor [Bacteroidaceae bacterium]|nr:RNA polymerase sigma factor [Bacteroidaceae bacterium]
MTDDAIIEQIREGETEQFARLVDRYARRVFGLIGSMVDDSAVVEDLAQETFVQAYTSLPLFRGDSPFVSWLLTIACRQALQWRRRRRLPTVSLDDEQWPLLDQVEVEVFFSQPDAERLRYLHEALDQLPSVDRAIVTLFYYDDLSTQEISRILETSDGAVRNRLYRIRQRLYLTIKQREHDENQS